MPFEPGAWEDSHYRHPDEDDDPGSDCDHENYESDILTGRAVCDRCGYVWYLSNEEVLSEIDHIAAYQDFEERENRRQWWRDLWSSIRSIIPRRKRTVTVNDDDIPF